MQHTIQLDIVSAEVTIFSGKVKWVFAMGELGELGITAGHTSLLSPLKPGEVRYIDDNDQTQLIYVSGGIIEVQPAVVTVLADSAIRAEELDESAANKAREEALLRLHDGSKSSSDDFNVSAALMDCAQAAAQIQLINKLKRLRGNQ